MCNVNISVIVPVYNVEKYIYLSVKSICEQTIDNYEIILVDDGTKDNSIEIAENTILSYGIKYTIVHKENGGLPSARNAGYKVASGKYVCFIDSDDVISNTHLEDLFVLCEKYELESSFSLFELTYTDRKGTACCNSEGSIIEREKLLHSFLLRKVRVHCCSLMIKRSFLENNTLYFDERLLYGEDIDFMWRMFPLMERIGCTNKETYKYFQRSNSLMTNQNIDRVINLLNIFKETVDNLKHMYPKDIEIFKYLYPKASLAFYRTFAESSTNELFEQLLKQTDYKKTIRNIFGIGDIRIDILAFCLLLSPKMFRKIVIMKRETV